MAAPNRNKFQIDRDRVRIADLYLRGKTLDAIAAALKVNKNTVRYDLKEIREEWQRSALMDFNEAKAQQLAKVDKVECELWEAWEKSKGTARRETEHFEKGKGKAQVLADRQVTKESQCGDPRYMVGILHCIERRSKILGLDAPDIPAGEGIAIPSNQLAGQVWLPKFSDPRPRQAAPAAN